MAHPSRKENVERIREALNLAYDAITLDDRPGCNDAMYTARKTWAEPIPKGCTHRVVIQDDAEVCENFTEIAEKVAQKFPDEIISFFHCEDFPNDKRYHEGHTVWGVALMIPVHLLPSLWEFVDNHVERVSGVLSEKILKKDTDCIRLWKNHRGIPYYVTTPSIVQHIGDSSLVGVEKKRIALDYTKNPPVSGW